MKLNHKTMLEAVFKLIQSGKVHFAESIPDNSKLVVTRVKDFDPASNDVWHLDANRSYPHEGMICNECGFDVVMSDGMFDMYMKNPRPEQIICNKCIFEIL